MQTSYARAKAKTRQIFSLSKKVLRRLKIYIMNPFLVSKLRDAYGADPANWQIGRALFFKLTEKRALPEASQHLARLEQHCAKTTSDADFRYLYGALAMDFRKFNNPQGARSSLENRVRLYPECMWAWLELASTYFRVGDVSNVKKVCLRHVEARDQYARRVGFEIQKSRYFATTYTYAIGHICILGMYAKLSALEGTNAIRNTLLVNPANVVNPTLLSYLLPWFDVISDEPRIASLEKTIHNLEDPSLMMRIGDRWEYFYNGCEEIQERWEKEGRAPLLKLSNEDEQHGRETLAQVGIPRDAWFVSLHVRTTSLGEARNARIFDYIPAIREITRRGGWVVRMGDTNMPPLPQMERTFDYAHSHAKSDRMDVYLFGACQFFIGTNSGPAFVPGLFGRRVLQTNYAPFMYNVPYSADILVPTLFRSRRSRKMLTFRELLPSPLVHAEYPAAVGDGDIEQVPNSSEEILAAVIEMLDSPGGAEGPNQKIFKGICQGLNLVIRPALSESFLEKHSDLLI